MQKIMHILFLSCLKATALIEKKLAVKLSLTQTLQLKIHKTMCTACKQYEKQSIFIDKVINETISEPNPQINIDELKEQIKSSLEKK